VFGLTVYTYAVMKFVAPLLVFSLVLIFFKELTGLQYLSLNKLSELKKVGKYRLMHVIVSIFVLVTLTVPAYYAWFEVEKNYRFNSMSIFNNPYPQNLFASNMLKHLSFDFLFVNGDSNLRHSIANFGQVLPVLIPFILLSILFFYFYKQKKKGFFLICLFLVGIMPPSLMFWNNPHALRSIAAVPALEIMAACGIFALIRFLKNRKAFIKIPILLMIAIAIILNAGFFFHAYFVKYPLYSGAWFQVGTEEAIKYAEKHYDKYDNIVLTPNVDQFYIFPLFFGKHIAPDSYETGKIGKYIMCKHDINNCFDENANNLYIVRINELQNQNLTVKQKIYNKLGYVEFEILD